VPSPRNAIPGKRSESTPVESARRAPREAHRLHPGVHRRRHGVSASAPFANPPAASVVFWSARVRNTLPVTIPDLGHCAGSGAAPVEGSLREENHGARSGVCPACSARFELHHTGVMSLHDAAEVDDREAWPKPSE
jgi:hypothetical protein